MMKPPKWIWRDKDISVRKEIIGGYNGESIEVFVMEPKHIKTEKIYPFVDQSMSSESNRKFKDTPMWNSTLSKLMVGGYVQDPDVELNETKGTMHGFDIAQKAPTTKAAIAARIDYMRRMF